MCLADLSQAEAAAAIGNDGSCIQVKRFAADVPAFETRTAHAGTNAFNNQRALLFRDCADDYRDGAAKGAAGIESFAEGDELDI
jgi:hypothetical protein